MGMAACLVMVEWETWRVAKDGVTGGKGSRHNPSLRSGREAAPTGGISGVWQDTGMEEE